MGYGKQNCQADSGIPAGIEYFFIFESQQILRKRSPPPSLPNGAAILAAILAGGTPALPGGERFAVLLQSKGLQYPASRADTSPL